MALTPSPTTLYLDMQFNKFFSSFFLAKNTPARLATFALWLSLNFGKEYIYNIW